MIAGRRVAACPRPDEGERTAAPVTAAARAVARARSNSSARSSRFPARRARRWPDAPSASRAALVAPDPLELRQRLARAGPRLAVVAHRAGDVRPVEQDIAGRGPGRRCRRTATTCPRMRAARRARRDPGRIISATLTSAGTVSSGVARGAPNSSKLSAQRRVGRRRRRQPPRRRRPASRRSLPPRPRARAPGRTRAPLEVASRLAPRRRRAISTAARKWSVRHSSSGSPSRRASASASSRVAEPKPSSPERNSIAAWPSSASHPFG